MSGPQRNNSYWLARGKVINFMVLSFEVNHYVSAFLIKRKLMS